MKSMSLGVNTFSYLYTHGLIECVRRLGAMGFRDFEILVGQPHFWATDFTAEERREIPKILSGEGYNLVSVNLPGMDNNIVSSTRDMREFTVNQLCDLIDLSGEWQIPYVIFVPGRVSPLLPMPRAQLEDHWVSGMTIVADRARAAGTRVLIENVPTTWIPHGKDLMAAIDLLGRDDVGIIYDPANAPAANEDPCIGVRDVKDRLDLVHLSDTPNDGWKHDPVGTGDMRFADFNEVLREIGYDGPSMIELITTTPDRDIPHSRDKLATMGWSA